MEIEQLIRLIVSLLSLIFVIGMSYLYRSQSEMYCRLTLQYIDIANHLSRIHIDNITMIMDKIPLPLTKETKELKELAHKALNQAKETLDLLEKE